MDILNWIYLRTNRLIKTTVNNPKDLVVLGADVTFVKRGDKYQTYAMTVSDLFNSTDVANTGYYSIDLNTALSSVVDVTTKKGVIEIIMETPEIDPQPAFASAVPLYINNAAMDFTDPDAIYMQHSVYYSPAIFDSFIPYVISTGITPTGSEFAIFNANPTLVGAITSFTPGAGTTILAAAGNTYVNVAATGGAPSLPAQFTVTRDGAGAIASVVLSFAGIGYVNGDIITLDGADIGGLNGVDDLTITVNNTTYENQFTGRFYLYYELYNF
jgi:hypothetical protein